MAVAGQAAGIGRPIIRNRIPAIRCDYINIEIDEPVSRDSAALSTDPMSRMAGGASKPIINMSGVLAEAGIGQDLAEIVTLRAQGVGTVDRQVRIGEQVHDGSSRRCRLAEFIMPFEQMQVL